MKNDEASAGSSSSPAVEPARRIWYALDVTIETSACEAVEYAMMEAGALGTELSTAENGYDKVIAYFEKAPDRSRVRETLFQSLRIYELPSSSVREMQFREVLDRDWLEEWKKSWQPSTIGRFIIAPPWSDVTKRPDQIIIRIEPGMAFGTGTHETTRLCLSAIEKYFNGESFLDVGTGTGILAIAAAKLSPEKRIEACDTDADAITIAAENAQLNEVADRIIFTVGTISETTASADLVCANLTADTIISLLPRLIDATCGRLVLSGILSEQADMVATRLGELGINEYETEKDGEWIAIIV